MTLVEEKGYHVPNVGINLEYEGVTQESIHHIAQDEINLN